MKTIIEPVVIPKKFPGVRLVIDIETEDELRVLRALYGFDSEVAVAIEDANYMTDSSRAVARKILDEAFEPLHAVAQEYFH
jgi:hypothetical protein